MFHVTFLSGAVLLAAGVTAAQAPGQRPDPGADVTRAQVIERVDRRFARLDADHDGRFTREEGQAMRAARRERRADRMFERLDIDRNGGITREEMNQARAQREARRAQRMAGGQGMRARRFMRGRRMAMMFGEQGFITREQVRERALARFDRADADRNGTLTAAERRAARPHRGMRRGPGAPEDGEN